MPKVMEAVGEFFGRLLEHATLGYTVMVLGAAAGVLYRSRIRTRLVDIVLGLKFRFQFWWNRIGIEIVTLDDYVTLLEKLRERIAEYDAKRTIKIYVLTMQLPRDWPLWGTQVDDLAPDKTPLEQYLIGFQSFLAAMRKTGHTVDVKRIVVIDSCKSPGGQERLHRLREDVESEYFDTYIKTLHADPSQALLHQHARMWPGWISDAVFYGLEGNHGTEWKWAVTTSYNAGEDLILLRLHSRLGRKLDGRFPIPWGETSLRALAERLDEHSFPILERRFFADASADAEIACPEPPTPPSNGTPAAIVAEQLRMLAPPQQALSAPPQQALPAPRKGRTIRRGKP